MGFRRAADNRRLIAGRRHGLRGRRCPDLLTAAGHAPRRTRRRIAEDRGERIELRNAGRCSERNHKGNQSDFEQRSGHQAASIMRAARAGAGRNLTWSG
jgi:hypothetical protein